MTDVPKDRNGLLCEGSSSTDPGDAPSRGGSPTSTSTRFSELDRTLLESSPDCVKIISLGGIVEYMNANGQAQLDVDDPSVVIGSEWGAMWPQAARLMIDTALAQAKVGLTHRFAAFCPTRKGRPKWWDVVVSPVRDGSGAIGSILTISRDATAQKIVEQTLGRSEQHFRALANNIAQLAWMTDANGQAFWYNQRWFDYTGTTLSDVVDSGWKTVCHPDHVDRVAAKRSAFFERGEAWEDIFPMRSADGSFRWFLSRAMPVREGDEIALWCGTDTDITDQRAQSQRLRQLVRIIDLSHEAVLVRDLDAGIVLWNRGCEELYGFDKQTAIGAKSCELLGTQLPLPPDEFDRLIVTEGAWSGELLQTSRDGSDVWVDSRQELMRIGGRSLVLESNRDITERRRADDVQLLLVAELNHRIKNTLAIVQSIASQTASRTSSLETFVKSFNGRLQSLASAHSVLTDAHWAGTSISDLVRSQIAVVAGPDARVDISGETFQLAPQSALQFTLILHELATNAVKYGALSNATGRVSITWHSAPGTPEKLELTWRETGGPPVSPPKAQGFGLTLIEKSNHLPHLNAVLEFDGRGLICHVKADLIVVKKSIVDIFNPGRSLLRTEVSSPTELSSQSGRRVLIMGFDPHEDLILEELIFDAGHIPMGSLTTDTEVAKKLGQMRCDMAIIDTDGAHDGVNAVVSELKRLAIPFIAIAAVQNLPWATGHLPEAAAFATKPIQVAQLLSTLEGVLANRPKV